MKNKKLILNICLFSTLFLIFSTSFIYLVFATKYDEDLSNLSSTNSATLKIGDNDYTINNDTDISGLIDLDMAILEYKEKKGENDYSTIYNQLLDLLEKNSTIINTDIINQTISKDTIWNITNNVNMTGNVTVDKNAKMVILSSTGAKVTRTKDISIISKGNLILQSGNKKDLTFDGNKNVLPDAANSFLKINGENTYFCDNITIQNSRASNGGGVYVEKGNFIMTGGVIGTKDITITWSNGNITKYPNVNTTTYTYIENIESINGNIAERGGGIFVNSGNAIISGGLIGGNLSSDSGGGIIYSSSKNSVINGGTFFGNKAGGNGGAVVIYKDSILNFENGELTANYTASFCGLDVYGTLNMSGDAKLLWNSVRNNGGGIGIEGGGIVNLSENAQISYNTAIGSGEQETNRGNAGGIRVTGTLNVYGGEISYNFANGYNLYNDDENEDTGNGGGIQGTTDTRGGVRKAVINLYGGNISNNKASRNGGGIYLSSYADQESAAFELSGTDVNSNIANENGGGIYLSAVKGGLTAKINNGTIKDNKAKNGGGVYVGLSTNATLATVEIGQENKSNDNVEISSNKGTNTGGGLYLDNSNTLIKPKVIMYRGYISNNYAKVGGGIAVNNGSYQMYNGNINSNNAQNGGGVYLINGDIDINGGYLDSNKVSQKGGGIYLGDANITMNNGNVQYNQSTNGNGGGIYLDNNSNFNFINGKVVYNSAATSSTPIQGTLAKNSTSGVGGGVYINSGIFSMYDDTGNAGTGAIYGNTATYAADDLFATGKDTKFDAIGVIEMKKADEYMTSDSWFEDFPEGEEHISLNKDNRVSIISKGRYKTLSDADLVDDMVAATTVLSRNCTDYIAITMGKGIGDLSLQIKDTNVQSDQVFLYKLEYVKADSSDTGELSMIVSVDPSKPTIVKKIPSGKYKLTLIPKWSWRYEDKVSANILVNNTTSKAEDNSFEFNIYSNQTTKCETSYFLKKNSNVFTKFFSMIAGDS